MLERLERKFGRNTPIMLEEIFNAVPEYSKQSVYRLVAEAVKEGKLVKFGKGVYYLPKSTEFGIASLSVERVIERKYVRDGKKIFGIYGRLNLEERFGFSTQVPSAIEVITNNASRAVRDVEVKGRTVKLRKSRVTINERNAAAYTILELFSDIDMKEYKGTPKTLVEKYIEEEKVTRRGILEIAPAFPARAVKNLALSGLI